MLVARETFTTEQAREANPKVVVLAGVSTNPGGQTVSAADLVRAIAATRDTVLEGVLLLAVYSAGLAIPFLLTALGIGQFLRFYQRFRRHVHAVEVFSGVLLLAVGGLIFVNRLTWLSGKLAFLNRFSW